MTRFQNMTRRRKIMLGILTVYVAGIVVFIAAFGLKSHMNNVYKPTDEFKLDTWFHIAGPIVFNKAVLYLLMSTAITIAIMVLVARSMQQRPNRLQTAVEWFYGLTQGMTKDNMDPAMARKWFPLVCTLFVFILVNNLLGYIPLPVNSGADFRLFGLNIPSFQIYAATANVSIPLVLALGVFIAYNVEGVRAHGVFGYLKSLIPPGVAGGMLLFIFPLELMSNFLRLLSLTIRLWANLLAGHLLIAFMAGALAVLLGLQVLGWFTLPAGIAIYLFEAVLIAGLQAFIFAILTAIYLGGATSTSGH